MDNLRLLMAKNGTVVRDLTRLTGVSGATIRNYLRGDQSPQSWWLVLVADYYGVTVDYLLNHWVCLAEYKGYKIKVLNRAEAGDMMGYIIEGMDGLEFPTFGDAMRWIDGEKGEREV